MPFLGTTPTQGFVGANPKQSFTADGSTTVFTLTNPVATANDLEVFVGNVRQEPTAAYSAAGTTLTMTEAPDTGLNFYVINKSQAQVTTTPPVNSISTDKIVANAVTGAKIASTISTNHTFSGANTFSGATTLPAATSAYQLLNTTTVSSSTNTLAFDNTIFTSNHQIYKVQFESLRGSNGVGIQVSPDNGSTYRTSGYNGTRRRWYTSNSGTAFTEQGNYYNDKLFYSSTSTGDATNYEVTILNMVENEKTMCIAYGGFGYSDAYHTLGIYSGRYNTVESHNSLKIYVADNGNFTAGKVSIFGIKTS